ncbi:MAG: hypothetical protein QM725_12360 [Lacibacter sp.]
MTKAVFNPTGEKLWVTVKMQGIYYITYVYYLWGTSNDSPAILTNPKKYNNNTILLDDYYQVTNDFKAGEKLSKFHERVIQVSLDINKLNDDPGYIITINIWQATEQQIKSIVKNLYNGDYQLPVNPLATEKRENKTGIGSVKEEKVFIQLIDSKKQ